MPTAARLIAGLCLALLGFALSEQIKTLFSSGKDFGYFSMVNAALGFVCGWVVIGSRAGRGGSAAVASGLTGGAALVFWGLCVQAVNEMVERSFDRRYSGPLEAISGAVDLFLEYAVKLLDTRIALSFLVGAILSGLMSEFAARRWR